MKSISFGPAFAFANVMASLRVHVPVPVVAHPGLWRTSDESFTTIVAPVAEAPVENNRINSIRFMIPPGLLFTKEHTTAKRVANDANESFSFSPARPPDDYAAFASGSQDHHEKATNLRPGISALWKPIPRLRPAG